MPQVSAVLIGANLGRGGTGVSCLLQFWNLPSNRSKVLIVKRLTALFWLLFAAYGTAVAQTSLPPNCSASDFSETGLPVMFPARNFHGRERYWSPIIGRGSHSKGCGWRTAAKALPWVGTAYNVAALGWGYLAR